MVQDRTGSAPDDGIVMKNRNVPIGNVITCSIITLWPANAIPV